MPGGAMGMDDAASAKAKLNTLFNALDTNGDGELSKDEVIAGHKQLNMTEKEAAKLFDDLDEDKSGLLTRSEFDAAESMTEEYDKMMAEVAAIEADAAKAEAAAAAAAAAATKIAERAKADADEAAKMKKEEVSQEKWVRLNPPHLEDVWPLSLF